MDTYQDLNPRGLVIPSNFGGVTFRTLMTLTDGMPTDKLRHALYYGGRRDHFYNWKDENGTPIMINMALMSDQAKAAGLKFTVSNSTERFWNGTGLIPLGLHARASGIIADLLEEEGWTSDNAAIALFNEPGKGKHGDGPQANCGPGIEGAKKYVEYVKRASELVDGRFPLWIINDEYHHIDEEYVFNNTKDVPKRVFGVHHLSSLGKTPAWKHVEYAATQAATWGVPVGCSEGGPWFHPYRSEEGHAIAVKLLEECAKFNYDFCAMVGVAINEYTVTKIWRTLGYLVYNNDYTELSRTDISKWNQFNNVLKLYKKEIPMPEYNAPEELQDIAQELGFETGEYSEELPILTGTGFWQNANKIHKPTDVVHKRQLEEFFEKTLKTVLKLAGKDALAAFECWYKNDGTYNSKTAREEFTKSNPKPE